MLEGVKAVANEYLVRPVAAELNFKPTLVKATYVAAAIFAMIKGYTEGWAKAGAEAPKKTKAWAAVKAGFNAGVKSTLLVAALNLAWKMLASYTKVRYAAFAVGAGYIAGKHIHKYATTKGWIGSK